LGSRVNVSEETASGLNNTINTILLKRYDFARGTEMQRLRVYLPKAKARWPTSKVKASTLVSSPAISGGGIQWSGDEPGNLIWLIN